MILCRGLRGHPVITALLLVSSAMTLVWSSSSRFLSSSARPLFTEVAIPSQQHVRVEYSSPVTFIGSCFSENMSKMLSARKFNVFSNPTGIAFNPISLSTALMRCIEKRTFTSDDLFRDHLDGELLHSWMHGREYSGIDHTQVLGRMNDDLVKGYDYLRTSTAIFVTLGTSFAYTLASNDQVIVSNCHKQPASQFKKITISSELALQTLAKPFKRLEAINPGCKVVITVSPIRHTREGIPENSFSKALLLTTAHHLCDQFEHVSYFPSYEIMMDELRDYRFYADDLIHPSNTAQEYIFEKFCHAYMCPDDMKIMKKIEGINKDIHHRPVVTNCPAYRRHLENCIAKLKKLEDEMRALKGLGQGQGGADTNLQKEIETCKNTLAQLSI